MLLLLAGLRLKMEDLEEGGGKSCERRLAERRYGG